VLVKPQLIFSTLTPFARLQPFFSRILKCCPTK